MSVTDSNDLLLRLRIARSALHAARDALDLPETIEARGQIDELIDDVREAIEDLSGAADHTHSFGPWQYGPCVTRRCDCGQTDIRVED